MNRERTAIGSPLIGKVPGGYPEREDYGFAAAR